MGRGPAFAVAEGRWNSEARMTGRAKCEMMTSIPSLRSVDRCETISDRVTSHPMRVSTLPELQPFTLSVHSSGAVPPPLEVPADVRPLTVMFLLTSMPVGGAETLVANLVRRMDRTRFAPEICCLKERGPIGEQLAESLPVRSGLLAHKYDLRVLPRLTGCLKRRVDAIVTVGAGDKMFWGRLACTGLRHRWSCRHFIPLVGPMDWAD